MRPPARAHHGRWAAWLAWAGLSLPGPLLLPVAGVAGTVVVDAWTSDGQALPGAAVTVRPLDGQGHPPAPVHAVMDQVNRAFVPDLLVIPVGSTVSFPNGDSVSHQIYSFSPAKRFQLPLYRGKPYPPVHFDQPGVVTLGCNIHDQMRGYLLVTDVPWYGLTSTDGTWTADLPPGRYRVALWHPRQDASETSLERDLTVGDTDRARVTVRLTKSLQPPPPPSNERAYSSDY
jgi:plastocyanin